MTIYSVADAKTKLCELIDRALKGERVVISRDGVPVVQLTASPRPVTEDDIALLDRLCYRPDKPFKEDSATLISRMRDEDDV